MVPSSGTISFLNHIRKEFAPSGAVNLLGYLNGGSAVSNTYEQIVNVPASGTLTMNVFRGNFCIVALSQRAASGTETVPSGAGNVVIELQGAGGGGSVVGSISSPAVAGYGGGSGSLATTNVACSSGQTFSYTGAAGGGGASGSSTAAGSTGGATSTISGGTITTMTTHPGGGAPTSGASGGAAGAAATGGNVANYAGQGGFSRPGGGNGASTAQSIWYNTPFGINYLFGSAYGYGVGVAPNGSSIPNGTGYGQGGGGAYSSFSGYIAAGSGYGSLATFVYLR